MIYGNENADDYKSNDPSDLFRIMEKYLIEESDDPGSPDLTSSIRSVYLGSEYLKCDQCDDRGEIIKCSDSNSMMCSSCGTIYNVNEMSQESDFKTYNPGVSMVAGPGKSGNKQYIFSSSDYFRKKKDEMKTKISGIIKKHDEFRSIPRIDEYINIAIEKAWTIQAINTSHRSTMMSIVIDILVQTFVDANVQFDRALLLRAFGLDEGNMNIGKKNVVMAIAHNIIPNFQSMREPDQEVVDFMKAVRFPNQYSDYFHRILNIIQEEHILTGVQDKTIYSGILYIMHLIRPNLNMGLDVITGRLNIKANTVLRFVARALNYFPLDPESLANTPLMKPGTQPVPQNIKPELLNRVKAKFLVIKNDLLKYSVSKDE